MKIRGAQLQEGHKAIGNQVSGLKGPVHNIIHSETPRTGSSPKSTWPYMRKVYSLILGCVVGGAGI